MNRLTKQWFDEVNTDALPTATASPSENRVYFKKSSVQSKSRTPKNDKGPVYHNLNSSSKSNNILLESTEDEYNSDEEEVVIDKQQIKNTLK